MNFLGQVQMAPRPMTVYPGVQGRPPVAVPTRPGWPAATPPYVTYPVDNIAWGDMDPPPYQGTTYDPKTDHPKAVSAPAPALPPAVPSASLRPANGPLPISDWFGLLKR
jgi:hypothetical protein